MKRLANLSIDENLLEDAKVLELDLSRILESSLRKAVALKQADHWKRDNAQALQSANEWVETHGLPLARYRHF